MSQYQPYFMKLGLTNSQSVDIGEYVTSLSKKNIGYYCTSDKCCSTEYKNKKGYSVYKRVSMVFKGNYEPPFCQCVDCGHSLLKKDMNDMGRVNIAEKKSDLRFKTGRKLKEI